MDLPDYLRNHDEWMFGPVHFEHGFLEIFVVSEIDEQSKLRRLVKIRFAQPFSFGWTTLLYMDQYLDESQPVVRQMELGALDAAVPGFRVDEAFRGENWQRYEIAAFDEVIYVLSIEPPTIETTTA